ncbi:UNVERIFIED_CONTAM: hypothetical protein GTU68_046862, partial [Idotea baltica]|nr:hypothetical protein [Idotea baltica]
LRGQGHVPGNRLQPHTRLPTERDKGEYRVLLPEWEDSKYVSYVADQRGRIHKPRSPTGRGPAAKRTTHLPTTKTPAYLPTAKTTAHLPATQATTHLPTPGTSAHL